MKEVVMVDAVRTPIGEFGGSLREIPAQRLAQVVIEALLKRTRLDPKEVSEVILGCVGQFSDAPNIARVASLMAGIPKEVPAFTVQRNCASGLQAITSAYQAIQAGDGDTFLVGGTESMSSAPYVLRGARFGYRLQHQALIDSVWEALTDPVVNQVMGRTAENLVEQYGISREEQDRYALESHQKAFRSIREGKFKEEIVPIEIPKKYGPAESFTQDESPKAGLSLEKLALYPTLFKEHGTVTPGNACPLNDGASVLLLMVKEKAKALGYEPLGTIRSYAYAGVAPDVMGIAPSCSTPKALERGGLKLADIDLVELNEAFAAQVLAVMKEMPIDPARLNVNGGAIALGHPVGCTGARVTTTLLYEMKRRGANLGLATMCVGGGQAGTLIVERT